MPPTTIVYIATSLDGYIARPDGAIDWLDGPQQLEGEDYGWSEFFPSVDAMVMGRKTFEQLLTFDEWHYGKIPFFVLTTTMADVPEHLQSQVELLAAEPQEVVAGWRGKVASAPTLMGAPPFRGFYTRIL